jgi:hypothetical protein
MSGSSRKADPRFYSPVRSPTQQNRTVISTEAAHAFVSSAVEKSASFPTPPSRDISHYIKGTHLIIPKSADRPLS